MRLYTICHPSAPLRAALATCHPAVVFHTAGQACHLTPRGSVPHCRAGLSLDSHIKQIEAIISGFLNTVVLHFNIGD